MKRKNKKLLVKKKKRLPRKRRHKTKIRKRLDHL
jgi:hypothetical protein